MITWKDYIYQSRQTAIYSDWAENDEAVNVIFASYSALGLIGELGELIEAVGSGEAERENTMKEIGDNFWYLADIASKYMIVEEIEVGDSILYSRKYTSSVDLTDILTEACRLGNICKKVIRDNEGYPTYLQRVKVATVLLYVLAGLQVYCYQNFGENGFTDVLQLNLDKLFSRQERGVLKGDGDNR